MRYTVYYVGAPHDGETLAKFDDVNDAINYADKFYDEHVDEFHPVWGGVAIDDEKTGQPVEW